MKLWAAIDLLGGSVVTLIHGKVSEGMMVSKEEPSDIAKRWQSEGADGLHVIDLDAAFEKGSNREAILRIIDAARVPVQVGGGVRSLRLVEDWLQKDGADRVILSTLAYQEPETLRRLLERYGPDKIIVAADYKDDFIVTRGWSERQSMSLLEAVKKFESCGVRKMLTTCVGRDGTGAGPDTATISELCSAPTKLNEIIASGGIRNISDLHDLAEAGAEGAILGRAIYEGTLHLSSAKKEMDF